MQQIRKNNTKIVIDTKTIIVNLLKEDEKETLNLQRLQKLICFIYDELNKDNLLDNYDILFDINFESIRRTVLYNNNIFELDFIGNEIRLKEASANELVKTYPIDNNIHRYISLFKEHCAA